MLIQEGSYEPLLIAIFNCLTQKTLKSNDQETTQFMLYDQPNILQNFRLHTAERVLHNMAEFHLAGKETNFMSSCYLCQ